MPPILRLIMSNMNFRFLILLAALGWLAGGCVSSNPQHFTAQVRKWVPLGTPATEAERVMTHHGFDCQLLTKDHPFNQSGADYLSCDKEHVRLHDWSVKFILEDGKVSKYGPMSVDGRSAESD
jgi:hypothetical protein